MAKQLLLIDTSVWIMYFRGDCSKSLKEFIYNSISTDIVATTEIIKLEILRGAKTEKKFNQLKEEFDALAQFKIDELTWQESYKLGFSLKRRGLTVPTVDILIATSAIINNTMVLHNDKHFDLISDHSALKTISAAQLSVSR